MKSYSPQNWYDLAKDLCELILAEIDNVSSDALSEVYPKLVVMYEFFRLVRGEAFHSAHPAGIGEFQKEIYKMEDNLAERLKQLERKLDAKDSKTSYHLDLMKKSFNLKYFNHE
jgi:predicted nucleotidyltransferase component of viral defense system